MADTPPFGALAFKWPWRLYQQRALTEREQHLARARGPGVHETRFAVKMDLVAKTPDNPGPAFGNLVN